MSAYLGAALAAQHPVICNRDDKGHCTANDGEPCVRCEAASANEAAYWRGQWNVATYEEKHGREKYEAELRDAGRGGN